MKQRNPRYGCPRIAQQINLAFGLNLGKDIIRRVLAIHYKPDPSSRGPSWLTTLGHAKDRMEKALSGAISAASGGLNQKFAKDMISGGNR